MSEFQCHVMFTIYVFKYSINWEKKECFQQTAQTVLWVCYRDALGDGDKDRHEVKNHVLTYKHSLMGNVLSQTKMLSSIYPTN